MTHNYNNSKIGNQATHSTLTLKNNIKFHAQKMRKKGGDLLVFRHLSTQSNRHLKVGQFGTCHGQFGTSIKNNLVIIKYLYKNKKRKLDLLASIVTVCVFVRHLFSFYPFYFDFHSARIIFDVSSAFYLWNINKTTA